MLLTFLQKAIVSFMRLGTTTIWSEERSQACSTVELYSGTVLRTKVQPHSLEVHTIVQV